MTGGLGINGSLIVPWLMTRLQKGLRSWTQQETSLSNHQEPLGRPWGISGEFLGNLWKSLLASGFPEDAVRRVPQLAGVFQFPERVVGRVDELFEALFVRLGAIALQAVDLVAQLFGQGLVPIFHQTHEPGLETSLRFELQDPGFQR